MIFKYTAKRIADNVFNNFGEVITEDNEKGLHITRKELQQVIEKAMNSAKERVEFHAKIQEAKENV